jgi:hypothetical protein
VVHWVCVAATIVSIMIVTQATHGAYGQTSSRVTIEPEANALVASGNFSKKIMVHYPSLAVGIYTSGGYTTKNPPTKIKTNGLRGLVERALRAELSRKRLDLKIVRRHEFKTNHGFRKFFQTNCEPKMKSLDVMTLMGQDTGLAASYNKPTVDMLLTEYLKAVENLTINRTTTNEEMIRNQQALVIDMQTKDREIHELKEQVEEIRLDMENLIKRNIIERCG